MSWSDTYNICKTLFASLEDNKITSGREAASEDSTEAARSSNSTNEDTRVSSQEGVISARDSTPLAKEDEMTTANTSQDSAPQGTQHPASIIFMVRLYGILFLYPFTNKASTRRNRRLRRLRNFSKNIQKLKEILPKRIGNAKVARYMRRLHSRKKWIKSRWDVPGRIASKPSTEHCGGVGINSCESAISSQRAYREARAMDRGATLPSGGDVDTVNSKSVLRMSTLTDVILKSVNGIICIFFHPETTQDVQCPELALLPSYDATAINVKSSNKLHSLQDDLTVQHMIPNKISDNELTNPHVPKSIVQDTTVSPTVSDEKTTFVLKPSILDGVTFLGRPTSHAQATTSDSSKPHSVCFPTDKTTSLSKPSTLGGVTFLGRTGPDSIKQHSLQNSSITLEATTEKVTENMTMNPLMHETIEQGSSSVTTKKNKCLLKPSSLDGATVVGRTTSQAITSGKSSAPANKGDSVDVKVNKTKSLLKLSTLDGALSKCATCGCSNTHTRNDSKLDIGEPLRPLSVNDITEEVDITSAEENKFLSKEDESLSVKCNNIDNKANLTGKEERQTHNYGYSEKQVQELDNEFPSQGPSTRMNAIPYSIPTVESRSSTKPTVQPSFQSSFEGKGVQTSTEQQPKPETVHKSDYLDGNGDQLTENFAPKATPFSVDELIVQLTKDERVQSSKGLRPSKSGRISPECADTNSANSSLADTNEETNMTGDTNDPESMQDAKKEESNVDEKGQCIPTPTEEMEEEPKCASRNSERKEIKDDGDDIQTLIENFTGKLMLSDHTIHPESINQSLLHLESSSPQCATSSLQQGSSDNKSTIEGEMKHQEETFITMLRVPAPVASETAAKDELHNSTTPSCKRRASSQKGKSTRNRNKVNRRQEKHSMKPCTPTTTKRQRDVLDMAGKKEEDVYAPCRKVKIVYEVIGHKTYCRYYRIPVKAVDSREDPATTKLHKSKTPSCKGCASSQKGKSTRNRNIMDRKLEKHSIKLCTPTTSKRQRDVLDMVGKKEGDVYAPCRKVKIVDEVIGYKTYCRYYRVPVKAVDAREDPATTKYKGEMTNTLGF